MSNKENTTNKEHFVERMALMAEEVWDFHNRFGIGSGLHYNDKLIEIIHKRKPLLLEEIQELDEACVEDDGIAIANEAADVLFVAMGTIEALDISGLYGAQRVTQKNADKTSETHAIREDTGKLLPKEGKPHKWE